MKLKLLAALLFPVALFSQGYTSYFTGNTTNITTVTQQGTCLMGGATEHDNAMKWLLEKANGGDVVVLRSSGSDGYNDYLYSELGINVNSVETLVISSVAGAINPYVLDKVANAEMIWFAGGDQWNYVSYFKDNALEDLLNSHINVKQAPIGGTSAGMAILGRKYFSAQNGTVTSAQALSNPYHSNMTLGVEDFLSVPYLYSVITDSHYDNPDRRGRHVAFMARLEPVFNNMAGIGANEYVAVCIDQNGRARVFGDYPNYDEFAYFLQSHCQNLTDAEVMQPGTPLTWNYGGEAVKVYKVPGTMTGEHYFDLSDWQNPDASGGTWENWSVVNGVLNAVAGSAPSCILSTPESESAKTIVYPNPFTEIINVGNVEPGIVKIYDGSGKVVLEQQIDRHATVAMPTVATGIYIVKFESDSYSFSRKLIKQ